MKLYGNKSIKSFVEKIFEIKKKLTHKSINSIKFPKSESWSKLIKVNMGQSNYFQTEQQMSSSVSPPKINPVDCQDKDGMRLGACQDELRLETPPRWQLVQSRVEGDSSKFYLGGSTLFLARHLGLVDIIEESAENDTNEARATVDSNVLERVDNNNKSKIFEEKNEDNWPQETISEAPDTADSRAETYGGKQTDVEKFECRFCEKKFTKS